MSNQTDPEILEALDQFAAADLRLAKKHGSILVASTTKGTLQVTYENRVYTIFNNMGSTLVCGPARFARAFLVESYDCIDG